MVLALVSQDQDREASVMSRRGVCAVLHGGSVAPLSPVRSFLAASDTTAPMRQRACLQQWPEGYS
jgi:hypothetical protein